MTDKQPDALRLADALETLDKNELTKLWKRDGDPLVVAMLRTQHAEIERLTACLKWEQNRAERIGTHGPGCEKWGPAHFECAVRAIERKDALLRKCLKHVASNITRDGCEAEELYDAIQQEVVEQ